MAKTKRSGIQEDMAQWRKFLKGVLERADRPHRLDHDWTRGKYGVCYEREPLAFCSKHWITDDDGDHLYTINDPFCQTCFPQPAKRARG